MSSHIIRIHRDAKISLFCSKKVSLVHVFRGEKELPFFDRLFKISFCLPLRGKQQQYFQVFVNREFIIIYSSKFSEKSSSENDVSETLKYTCVPKI